MSYLAYKRTQEGNLSKNSAHNRELTNKINKWTTEKQGELSKKYGITFPSELQMGKDRQSLGVQQFEYERDSKKFKAHPGAYAVQIPNEDDYKNLTPDIADYDTGVDVLTETNQNKIDKQIAAQQKYAEDQSDPKSYQKRKYDEGLIKWEADKATHETANKDWTTEKARLDKRKAEIAHAEKNLQTRDAYVSDFNKALEEENPEEKYNNEVNADYGIFTEEWLVNQMKEMWSDNS